MPAFDAFLLARRQLQLDRVRTREFPWFLNHKIERMQASPFAFLRGAAPLFYEILQSELDLAKGPPGTGWITGDLHLENFGAYRQDRLAEHRETARVLFDINDFDEAVVGPWRFDVLRLVTSFVLTAHTTGASVLRILEACGELVSSYVATAMNASSPPEPPEAVAQLVETVRKQTRKQLLDARTKIVGGSRRFIRGERYRDLGSKLAQEARRAFSEYANSFPDLKAKRPKALDVLDVAFRIAGTGSLGQLRVAVLARGKGGTNGAWLFDMKEGRAPAPSLLVEPPRMEPAQRVGSAFRACLECPPQMIGTTHLDGRSMFVRRLAPQEDRINLRHIQFEELTKLAVYFASLAGTSHRRGATKRPPAWSRLGCEQIIDSALAMAIIHEGTYLAFCRLTRDVKRAEDRGTNPGRARTTSSNTGEKLSR